jgi:ketosteroid isomerase-like protein
MEMADHPVQVVEAWIDAVNEGDVERAGTLVADDVSIIGPRGTTGGREAVRGWIGHTGCLFESRRH